MIQKRAFVLVYLLLLGTFVYLNLHRDLQVPIGKPLVQFPASVNGWQLSGDYKLSDEVQKVLRATDVLTREYVNAQGERVTLYIGYHSGGKGSGEIHSPKNCLPGSGWFEVSSAPKNLAVSDGNLNLVQAMYRKGGRSELFLYWFQVRDKSISSEYSLKAAEIVNSALHRRRDASFIRVSVPFETDPQKAIAIGEKFVTDFFPVIRGFLPS